MTFVQNPGAIANCVSVVAMGDEAFRDGTIELELRAYGDTAGRSRLSLPVDRRRQARAARPRS